MAVVIQVRRILLLMLSGLSLIALPAFGVELSVSEADRKDWGFIGQISHGHDRLGLCTGTLIAPDLVLTAAHCVVNPKSGKIAPFHRVRFRAGLHEGEETSSSFARRIDVLPGYLAKIDQTDATSMERFASDIALVTLKHPIDAVPGARVSSPVAPGVEVSVLGYQKASPDVLIDYIGCAVASHDARFLGLSCAVKSGTSGGPVLRQIDDTWQVIGVVVAATAKRKGAVKGVAVRVDSDRLFALFPEQFPRRAPAVFR